MPCVTFSQMESTEADIKPTIAADDIPGQSSLAVSDAVKLRHSRYEDVWPEDVHAAFMEAVALYPPMGKRRLKYYRVSMHENAFNTNRAKSFGRCQLIQSYILEKTGKNRSRKQVSSHLQRLKKIHKDNPAMRPLFSERSQPPLMEHHCPAQAISSQDLPTNSSVSTACHLESDLDLVVNVQNTDTDTDSFSALSYASEGPYLNGGSRDALNLSTNFYDQPSFSSPQEFLSPILQHRPAGVLYRSDSDYLTELQDALLFKDAANERSRTGSAFNSSAFSTSMRQLASRFPVQGWLLDSGPTMHHSRSVQSLGFQPTHLSHGSWMDGHCNSPLTSVQETLPPQCIPLDNPRLYPGFTSEWMWSKYPNLPVDPREGYFAELRLRYPPAMYQYNHIRPEVRIDTPEFHSSRPESETSRFGNGFSCSYAMTSPAIASERDVSTESTIYFPTHRPEPSENLASPLVIRPTPLYPFSYMHSDMHSSIHPKSRTPVLSPSLDIKAIDRS